MFTISRERGAGFMDGMGRVLDVYVCRCCDIPADFDSNPPETRVPEARFTGELKPKVLKTPGHPRSGKLATLDLAVLLFDRKGH